MAEMVAWRTDARGEHDRRRYLSVGWGEMAESQAGKPAPQGKVFRCLFRLEEAEARNILGLELSEFPQGLTKVRLTLEVLEGE